MMTKPSPSLSGQSQMLKCVGQLIYLVPTGEPHRKALEIQQMPSMDNNKENNKLLNTLVPLTKKRTLFISKKRDQRYLVATYTLLVSP